MAAKDALNPDLFTTVYHASLEDAPPHTLPRPSRTLFAGTLDSANDTRRKYIHAYDVPKSMISPELWADDMRDTAVYEDTGYTIGGNYTEEQMLKHSIPKQPELWESRPARPKDAGNGKVIQYRNDKEDPGSISYIMNTDDIDNPNTDQSIRYRGMTLRKK
jgi:hypothetical protein